MVSYAKCHWIYSNKRLFFFICSILLSIGKEIRDAFVENRILHNPNAVGHCRV